MINAFTIVVQLCSSMWPACGLSERLSDDSAVIIIAVVHPIIGDPSAEAGREGKSSQKITPFWP